MPRLRGSAVVALTASGLAACAGPANPPASPRGGSFAEGGVDGAARPSAPDSGSPASIRPIASPPTYRGTRDGGAACDTQYGTLGFEPTGGVTGHPLLLYFVGTKFLPGDTSSSYDSQAAIAVTSAMARRGFVALSVEYDNTPAALFSDHESQLACLFGPGSAASVLAVACAMPGVDCARGIATWGHSQGALVADLAARADGRVRAVWTTGYGGDARSTLSKNRLRVVNGEGDTTNAQVPTLNRIAGFTATECPDDGRKECLRADGSGWIVVTKPDCQVTSADHCWFDKKSCADTPEVLEPNWVSPTSTKAFALEANADWVAATLRRP